MSKFRNYRNFYPSGIIESETPMGRFLQKSEETIRPYVDYLKIPVTAAAIVASVYPIYKDIRDTSEDAAEVTKHLFAEYIDSKSAKEDPMFKEFQEKWGKKQANILMRELESAYEANRKARENAPEHGPRRRVLSDFTSLAPSNLREFWRSRRDPKGYEKELYDDLDRIMESSKLYRADESGENIIIEPEIGDEDSDEY